MSLPNRVRTRSDYSKQVAEEKGRGRVALASLPPEEAQALVTSLPPNGGCWVDVTPELSPEIEGFIHQMADNLRNHYLKAPKGGNK
jgi:hypothetical protein